MASWLRWQDGGAVHARWVTSLRRFPINARGEVSQRSSGGGIPEGFQRHLLEEEGVVFDQSGRIDLERYRWEPRIEVLWS